MIVNNPGADANYKTFEVAVMKRPAQGWQIGSSFSSTWVDVPISCGASGSGLGSGSPLIWYTTRCLTNPNQVFNTANQTREWQAKVSGAYNLPFGILASANYDIRNGLRVARQVLFTGGTAIRSISLNVEPIGSFSLPRTHELDVRVAKRVNLGAARSVELRFDIYNALNKGTATVHEPAVRLELPASQPRSCSRGSCRSAPRSTSRIEPVVSDRSCGRAALGWRARSVVLIDFDNSWISAPRSASVES